MGYRKHGVSEAPGPGRWAKHSVQQWVMTWEEQKKVFFSFAGFEDGLADGWDWASEQHNCVVVVSEGQRAMGQSLWTWLQTRPDRSSKQKGDVSAGQAGVVFDGLRLWFDELCTYQYTPHCDDGYAQIKFSFFYEQSDVLSLIAPHHGWTDPRGLLFRLIRNCVCTPN
jgi:hypothetical protein